MTYRNKSESLAGIALSGGLCIICGWCKRKQNGESLVEGAHVKPIEYDYKSDNRQNIIALCPNHHTMFDNYLFYIDPQTKHTVFADEKDIDNRIDLSAQISHIKPEYLAYRQYLFEHHNMNRV